MGRVGLMLGKLFICSFFNLPPPSSKSLMLFIEGYQITLTLNCILANQMSSDDKPSLLSAINTELRSYILVNIEQPFFNCIEELYGHWGHTAPRYTCQWAYYVSKHIPR